MQTSVHERHHRRVVIPFVAKPEPHLRVVFLLDMSVVVLLVGTAAGESHGLGPLLKMPHQVVVDELTAIVAVHSLQDEGQMLFDRSNLL